jgi:uncharacterized membrane protein
VAGIAGRAAFVLSAFAFGWALAFKQFAILLWPFVLRHLASSSAEWRRYAVISAGVAAAFVVPFLVWSPGAFIDKQVQALTFHDTVWGANLPAMFQQRTDIVPYLRLFFVAEIVGTAGLLIVFLRHGARSIGVAALMGAGLLVVPLVLARWTTQSYYVYAATIALTGLLLIDERARLRT